MNHAHDMIAAQYAEYVRRLHERRTDDDDPRPKRRRRAARGRVSDAVDPGEL